MIPQPLCSTALSCPVCECCARDDRHYDFRVLEEIAREYKRGHWSPDSPCQIFLQLRRKISD